LKVYAISITQQLPVGRIYTSAFKKTSGVAPHPSVSVSLTDTSIFNPEVYLEDSVYALCGGGGEVHYTGLGNMLWSLRPSTTQGLQFFSASSKDHLKSDPSSISAYAMGILLSPNQSRT
jgi:hypothetical protein